MSLENVVWVFATYGGYMVAIYGGYMVLVSAYLLIKAAVCDLMEQIASDTLRGHVRVYHSKDGRYR